jgi:molecular chaperone DnaK
MAGIAADNDYIGEVILPLTTSRRAGEHRINCLFKVDHNGILTVRAESADTEGKAAEMVFAYGSMSPSDVEEKLKVAAEHRKEDELTRRIIQLKRELADLRELIDEKASQDLRTRLNEVEVALDARDADAAASQITTIKKELK